MSYILDALRKAEQERTFGHTPTLDSIYAPPPSRQRFWPWLLAAVILSNVTVAAVVWWFWRQDLSPAAVATTVSPEVAPAPDEPVIEPAFEPDPVALSAPVSLPSQPITPDPPPEVFEDVPFAPVEIASAPLSTAPDPAVPEWNSLPVEFRQSMPFLNLDIHIYSDDPTKRFVLINSQRYHEGERLAEGPQLEMITVDGVVLSHRGRRFMIGLQQ